MEINNFVDEVHEEIANNRCIITQDDVNKFAHNIHEEIANNPQLWFPGEEEEFNVSYIYIYIYIYYMI